MAYSPGRTNKKSSTTLRRVEPVIGTHEESAEQLGAWIRWYEDEPLWLDWALPHHGQPSLEAVFVPT